ncbi:dioxygenase family protein [Actinomadura fibrosa]|uniref:Dioxygenase n=1 Tax=Actinomadura fibrosa TaxID=111802 RepID=A0ABW2XTJ3_9ACTN|nr:dioxygenase [Actinomadura fibrosa]
MSTAPDTRLLKQVLATVDGDDPRLKQVVSALVTHLHAFVNDVRPTEQEWLAGLDFLIETGQRWCGPHRNEFILLSDMLGLTTAVDDVNHRGPDGMTPSSVEGPFHSPAPPRELGDWISSGPERDRATPTVVHGRVLDCDGTPLPGAVIDLWQANDTGLYDSQDDSQDQGNLRALLTTDAEGSYWFRTIRPSSYPVPTDGTAGRLLKAIGRHPMRPAHLHVKVTAPGYRTLTTHVFLAEDPYLDSDAAFAVKPELICVPRRRESPGDQERWRMDGPFEEIEFDLRLVPLDWTADDGEQTEERQ